MINQQYKQILIVYKYTKIFCISNDSTIIFLIAFEIFDFTKVINTAMDSATQTTDGDIKLNSDLFDLAEKLRIELQKKDEELQKKDEELADKNQEITVNLD
jgi:hypothetical protein